MDAPPPDATARSISHGLLLGLLRSLGGAAELSAADYDLACTNIDTAAHAVSIEPTGTDGQVRLVLVERGGHR